MSTDTKDKVWEVIYGDNNEYFDEQEALSEMLSEPNLLFIGGDSGPFFNTSTPDRNAVCVYINCNDLFYWGCADSEPLPHDKIEEAWRGWKAGDCSLNKIACVQRGMQPQNPIVEQMKKDGEWDNGFEALPKAPKS